ncbi:hypothetical protein SAMN06295945_1938 [Polynucleobacter meluiroseus]|uniref:Uncharacterized protein n=1 Tax=Polynucleobacter meluiroseus TaxID=1938814 RepID=A0A240E2A0_9BURK|nr:DUF4258 domain-containing protein [Polynucleobacter meluiroseus]SNX29558.1 hypothetical protein SAMN06295945_1938 [Polynucleobacter meluiroseus]
MYTKHAQKRISQRGIQPFVCEMLLAYGEKRFDGHGGLIRYFSERSISRLISDKGISYCKKNIKSFRTYLVESTTDGGIITAGINHVNHKFKALSAA